MPIYCDESGGVSAGVMTLAAVHISEANSNALLNRFRTVTGLHGELKGSRIDYTERGFFYELFDRFDAHGIVATIDLRAGDGPSQIARDRDYAVYAALTAHAVGAHLARKAGKNTVIIDEGRYDPRTLELVRRGIEAMLESEHGLNHLGAHFADSRRCPGVQIADVVANTFYNAMIGGQRGERMDRIVQPFLTLRRVNMVSLDARQLAQGLAPPDIAA